jgi:hypothetical protein
VSAAGLELGGPAGHLGGLYYAGLVEVGQAAALGLRSLGTAVQAGQYDLAGQVARLGQAAAPPSRPRKSTPLTHSRENSEVHGIAGGPHLVRNVWVHDKPVEGRPVTLAGL